MTCSDTGRAVARGCIEGDKAYPDWRVMKSGKCAIPPAVFITDSGATNCLRAGFDGGAQLTDSEGRAGEIDGKSLRLGQCESGGVRTRTRTT